MYTKRHNCLKSLNSHSSRRTMCIWILPNRQIRITHLLKLKRMASIIVPTLDLPSALKDTHPEFEIAMYIICHSSSPSPTGQYQTEGPLATSHLTYF